MSTIENQENLNDVVEDIPGVHYVDPQKADEEYEKITGKKTLGMEDASFEALITDPNLILRDLRELCVKHEIDFVGMFTAMGFNTNTFKALLVNKPITEQIFVLSREISLLLYQLGKKTEEITGEPFSTLNIRNLMGDPGTSKEWLELLDNTIFPYMSEFEKNGKLDKDWFLKNNQEEDEIKAFVDEARDLIGNQMGMVRELEAGIEAMENIQDEIELSHGDETVLETTEEVLEEAQENVQSVGDIVVEESIENESQSGQEDFIDNNDEQHLV